MVDESGYEWTEFGGMSGIPRRYHRLFSRCLEPSGAIENSVLAPAGSQIETQTEQV